MIRIMAMRMKAPATRQWRSKSRASRQLRLIQPMVRSTIRRFGSTTNLCLGLRLLVALGSGRREIDLPPKSEPPAIRGRL